jgi:hypothetical protein
MMIIGSVLQCIQGQQGRSMICGKINKRKTMNLSPQRQKQSNCFIELFS